MRVVIIVMPIFLPADSYYNHAHQNASPQSSFLSMDIDYPEDRRLETLEDASLRSGLSARYIRSKLTHPIHSEVIDGERYFRRVYVDILFLKLTEDTEVYA